MFVQNDLLDLKYIRSFWWISFGWKIVLQIQMEKLTFAKPQECYKYQMLLELK